MTWQDALIGLAIFGGLAVYWWFAFGRFGTIKKYYARKLGLAEGEEVVEFWQAAHNIERSIGSYVWEAVSGRGKRGATLVVGLTSWNRLAIGALESSDEALHFRQCDVFASGSRAKPKYKHFSGTHGFEKTAVILLTTTGGHQLSLDVPRTCLSRLQAWTSATPWASGASQTSHQQPPR